LPSLVLLILRYGDVSICQHPRSVKSSQISLFSKNVGNYQRWKYFAQISKKDNDERSHDAHI